MFKGYRVVSVTPAGRQRYLELLIPYLLDNRHLIDEHHFWVNTNQASDLAYLESMTNQYPDFFKLDHLDDPRMDVGGIKRVQFIGKFFVNCCDKNTIYVRLDDDICYIHENAIENLLKFRVDNPEFFLVYPAIINSGRTAYIHQVMGLLPERLIDNWPGRQCDEFNLIKLNPQLSEIFHEAFLNKLSQNKIEELFFGKYIIKNYEKVPINCICWFGSEFAKFDGIVGSEETRWQEEMWLTTYKAKALKKPSCIVGNSLMAHFAFHTQREVLEQTNMLLKYQIVCKHRHNKELIQLP